MARWWGVFFALAACAACTNAASEAGKYFVTAPQTIVPGHPYTLTLQILDSPSPVQFEVFLQQDNGYSGISRAFVNVIPAVSKTVAPGALETVTMDIPEDLIRRHTYNTRRYRITVRGTGGLQIEDTFSVSVNTKLATIFVQLDRYAYEPGNRVTFKTFAIRDIDLTAYTGVYNVQLMAPGNVVVKSWQSTPGDAMATFEYDLDIHTVLGRWTIHTSGEETGTASHFFEVGSQEKRFQAGQLETDTESKVFDVTVTLPRTMNSSTDLEGTFEASYPGAMQVKGLAEVYGPWGETDLLHIPFTGNGSFVFPYGELSTGALTVKVKVTEESTGITSSGQSTVEVYDRDVKVEFTEQTPAMYKPRLPVKAYVKISNHADEPLQIPADSIFRTVYVYGVGHYSRPAPADSHFGVGTFSGSYPILAKKLTLPDSGLFSVDVDIPDDVTRVDLRVTFQGIQKTLSMNRAENTGGSYLQIYLLGDVPAVTDTQTAEAHFRVISSQPLTDLTVELVSRGQLVQTSTPTLLNHATSGDSYSAEFSLTLTWDMSPVTDVVAYHLLTSGGTLQSIASDSIRLNVQGLLENKVEVTSDQQRAEPGQEVTFGVGARPGSTVGLLVQEDNGASDQAITPASLFNIIQGSSHAPLSTNSAMATSQQYWSGTFTYAGLTVVDGRGLRYPNPTNPVMQTGYSKGRLDENPNTVFFGTNTTGADGRATFSVNLPDIVGRWSVTGFALDSAGHVGVVETPFVMETLYAVYGELLGPRQFVYGEHVILSAYVHNTKDTDSQVTITLRPQGSVEILTVKQDGTHSTSTTEQQQSVTIPAKTSKQIFFTVTSAKDQPASPIDAALELVIQSENSKQIISHVVTVVPNGVEQTITTASLIDVSGHVAKDIAYISAPKEAVPGAMTKQVTVTNDFDELILPLAIQEEDVMEEGTGDAALVHFALPVMLAQTHPELQDQLTGPIERGHQRILNFMNGYRYQEMSTTHQSSWMSFAVMKLLSEASTLIEVDKSRILDTLFSCMQSYPASYTMTAYDILTCNHWGPIWTAESEAAFAAMAIQNLAKYVDVSGHLYGNRERYYILLNKTETFLQVNHSSSQDPLTMSYLALANLKYGYKDTAANMLTKLLSLADPNSDAELLFWNSNPNDTYSYYGDWLPGRHVASSRDLLIAANTLQLLTLTGETTDADRVARWLFQQRQGSGLFKTALDTLTATEALMTYSAQRTAILSSLQLGTSHSQPHNGRTLSQGELTNFTANGQGKVFSQVDVKYRVTDDVGDASFEVVPVVLDESLQHFKLMICSRWLLETKASGVAVQEVTVPSGFVADVTALTRNNGVMKYIRRNETTTTIYFRQFGQDSSCYTLPVDRVYSVAKSAPAYIVTRRFETPENRDIVSYQPRRLGESSVCDLCSSCCV